MPSVILPVPQKGISVSRAAVRDVVQQIASQTGFPSAEIVFNEEQGQSRQQQSNIDKEENAIRTKYNNFIFVEYTERFTDDAWLQKNIHMPDHHLLFKDPITGITIAPVYANVEVTLSLRFRAKNKTSLVEWQSNLRLRNGIQALIEQLQVQYDFSLPDSILAFLVETAKSMNAISLSDKKLSDYLKLCLKRGSGVRKNLSGEHKEFIIGEMQKGILGQSTDEDFYQEISSEEGIYEINAPYRFFYDQVMGVRLYTPAVVYNSIVSQDLLKSWCPKIFEEQLTANTETYPFLDTYEAVPEGNYPYRGDGGTRYIEWDEWFPTYYRKHGRTLTIVPVLVDVSKPREIFNLNDLNDGLLPDGVVDYAAAYWEDLPYPLATYLDIELFEVSTTERMVGWAIDEDLNITCDEDMSPSKRYYIRVSAIKDLTTVRIGHVADCLSNPARTMPIFRLHDPEVTLGGDDGVSNLTLLSTGDITDQSYNTWLRGLIETNNTFKKTASRFSKTVGTVNLKSR